MGCHLWPLILPVVSSMWSDDGGFRSTQCTVLLESSNCLNSRVPVLFVCSILLFRTKTKLRTWTVSPLDTESKDSFKDAWNLPYFLNRPKLLTEMKVQWFRAVEFLGSRTLNTKYHVSQHCLNTWLLHLPSQHGRRPSTKRSGSLWMPQVLLVKLVRTKKGNWIWVTLPTVT